MSGWKYINDTIIYDYYMISLRKSFKSVWVVILNSLRYAYFRLSRIAGGRLRDGNPFIADLGDINRPDKLAERFSELYDNEWSDVMEKMPVDESEEHKVDILLNILKVSNHIFGIFFSEYTYIHI